DLVGLLSNPRAFSINTFKADVEQVKSQITFLRDAASHCQTHAKWGLSPMTGWMQSLDSRWYLQLQKNVHNWIFEDLTRGPRNGTKQPAGDRLRRVADKVAVKFNQHVPHRKTKLEGRGPDPA